MAKAKRVPNSKYPRKTGVPGGKHGKLQPKPTGRTDRKTVGLTNVQTGNTK